jgi:hypothetical protein
LGDDAKLLQPEFRPLYDRERLETLRVDATGVMEDQHFRAWLRGPRIENTQRNCSPLELHKYVSRIRRSG